jgi:hypothetical protein
VESTRLIEHGGTRTGRWLRERRLRFAAWIAVVEGILVAFGVIPWFAALTVAVLVLVAYFGWARSQGSATVRQAGWIVAVSQALVALVPVLVVIATTLAIVAVAIIAVLALVVLLTDRR